MRTNNYGRIMRNRFQASIWIFCFNAGFVTAQTDLQHFTPVTYTGIKRMVVINGFADSLATVSPGDELALFDGDVCAGAVVIEPNDRGELFPLSIASILFVELPDGSTRLGARLGQPIRYWFWDKERNNEFELFARGYVSGEGRFWHNTTVVTMLDGSDSLSVSNSAGVKAGSQGGGAEGKGKTPIRRLAVPGLRK